MMLLVHDIDATLQFYTGGFGMRILLDSGEGGGRMVQLGSAGLEGELWLLAAETEAQRAKVGHQGGDMPLSLIYSGDLAQDLSRLATLGREPMDGIVEDGDGTLHCRIADLYGNLWVLAQLPEEGAKPARKRAAASRRAA